MVLAHGGGGRLMHELLDRLILPTLGATDPKQAHDAAIIEAAGQPLAFTTDSYVVNPLFFPGGDIGSLAVHGTVNDLAMRGARPLYLSVGLIIEEGLPMGELWRILQSMRRAADWAGLRIVTGDTKVVDRGKGDGIFINTTGVGTLDDQFEIHPSRVEPGDVVLTSGDLGRHGTAIMAHRQGLEFESTIDSDTAPLAELVSRLLKTGIDIHCLRDLTRGGLASALNEIAQGSQRTIEIEELALPVSEAVQSACELLGLDSLYMACEGRFVAFVPESAADRALESLHCHHQGQGARVIGRVAESRDPRLVMTSRIGAKRIIDMLSGEQLPRIC